MALRREFEEILEEEQHDTCSRLRSEIKTRIAMKETNVGKLREINKIMEEEINSLKLVKNNIKSSATVKELIQKGEIYKKEEQKKEKSEITVTANDVLHLIGQYRENEAKRQEIAKLEKELGDYKDCPLNLGEMELAIKNMNAEIEELQAKENAAVIDEVRKMSSKSNILR